MKSWCASKLPGSTGPDILQREGRYPVPADADPLPGLEVAGEVVLLGRNTQRWNPGDRVMALTHGGGYAEYVRVHEAHCLPVPNGLSAIQATAIPETFFTVWYNVFMRNSLERDETILVHGGSSGIGTTAIQLAKSRGASVIVTAGSAEKCDFCRQLGADLALNYRTDDWPADVRRFSGDRGIDVVLDMVAGSYMQKNLSVLARDGRYIIIAFLDGSRADLDMRDVVAKRLTVTGSTLRPQTSDEKAAIAQSLREHVLPDIESGAIGPIIDRVFPLADAPLAHEYMESSQHMGKIVLQT